MEEEKLIAVQGIVDTIIYQNKENYYTVCGLNTPDDDQEILVGTLPYVNEGDHLVAFGRYTVNPKYGKQFLVASFEKTLPTKKSEILQYLSSGAVKGIGPKLGAKIVARFGEDTFDVLENHPNWLAEVPGISQKNAEAISQRFAESAGARQILMYCQDFLSPAMALRIYRAWGKDAMEKLLGNPYQLCDQYYRISFSTADRMGMHQGVSKNDPKRIKAGILFVLLEMAEKHGHTCYPEKELLNRSRLLLGETVTDTEMMSAMKELQESGRLYFLRFPSDNFWFRSEYYEAESYIAKKLDQIQRLCPPLTANDARRLIQHAETESGLTYAKEQRQALFTALREGVMILTGGPGTGKTTVIKSMVSVFESLNFKVALAAPTGRAAKRMSEATSHEAKTIHRLLEIDVTMHEIPEFTRNEKNPLDEHVIIIDEASMLDVMLMHSLLKAVRAGSRLILIGDINQLPSVGAGNLLGDLIQSERFSTIFLTEIFRQTEDSGIIFNAHEVMCGRMPDLHQKKKDFFFLRRNTAEEVADTVVDLVKTRLPATYGQEVLSKIQVITPTHKGPAGTIALNIRLQQAINPGARDKEEKNIRTRSFREGDKIMQVRNNYSLEWSSAQSEGIGIFNGDIGLVEKVDHENERLILRFDDRRVLYDFDFLDELEHAYAITVHKSQGSEYPVVLLPLTGGAPMLQTRHLLYTALTRASQMVILVGKPEVMEQMVSNDRQAWRSTALPYFLRLLGDQG